jgi:hypothetical protein
VSRVRVTKRTKLFVITGEERWTRDHAGGDRDQPAIDPNCEFGQGVGLIDIVSAQEFGSGIPENFLSRNQYLPIVLAAPGNIEQTNKHPLMIHPNGIVKVSSYAFTDKNGAYVSSANRGKNGRDWFNG